MPRLLTKRIDYVHPTKPEMSYRRGDVVWVAEDEVRWNKIEDEVNPEFAIITTTGDVNSFKHLQEERELPRLRRAFHIDFDDMDAGELADLDTAPYKTSMVPGRVNVLSKEKP